MALTVDPRGDREISAAQEAMTAVREQLSLLRPIERSSVDVAGCVARAVRAASLPSDINVSTERLADLPEVMANRESLTLVLANLLQNASNAMKGYGRISIEGAAQGAWVEIAVRDTGPGIPAELHDRIFELNFSSQSGGRSNLGFGLWWVKTLMTRLGGAVSVESDGRSGTTFRLKLPRGAR